MKANKALKAVARKLLVRARSILDESGLSKDKVLFVDGAGRVCAYGALYYADRGRVSRECAEAAKLLNAQAPGGDVVRFTLRRSTTKADVLRIFRKAIEAATLKEG